MIADFLKWVMAVTNFANFGEIHLIRSLQKFWHQFAKLMSCKIQEKISSSSFHLFSWETLSIAFPFQKQIMQNLSEILLGKLTSSKRCLSDLDAFFMATLFSRIRQIDRVQTNSLILIPKSLPLFQGHRIKEYSTKSTLLENANVPWHFFSLMNFVKIW